MILGKNLIVHLDGVAIAGNKTCQIELSQDFIKACAPTDSRTFKKIPTTYDWSISVDCLIPNSSLPNNMMDRLIAGTKVLLTFTDSSNQRRAGFAYIKSCREGGSIGSLATFSVSFESTGPLYCYTQWSGSWPQEGGFFDLSIVNDALRVEHDGSMQEWKVSVSYIGNATKSGRMMIFTDDVWALYDNNDIDVARALSQTDTQLLEADVYKFGQGDAEMNIAARFQGTILCNAMPTILFLYEV